MKYKAKRNQIRKRSPAPERPPPEGMTLGELAASGGVSPRAIRHYLHAGLLPQVVLRGPRTRYGPAYLARLFAIRALLRRGLDFAAIRARLRDLSAAEIDAYLPSSLAPPSPALPALALALATDPSPTSASSEADVD